jgi:hemerythrin-like domain-containing protein
VERRVHQAEKEMIMKSTTLLIEDHKHILRAIDVLERLAACSESGETPSQDDVQDIVTFLKGFVDRFHHGREECVLFPALLSDRGQKHYKELRSLTFEHNRQQFLVEGIQDSARGKNAKEFTYCARRLAEIMREHIKEEATTSFPLVDSTISPATDEIVFRGMKAHDNLWQHNKLPLLLRRLDDLATKYPPVHSSPIA